MLFLLSYDFILYVAVVNRVVLIAGKALYKSPLLLLLLLLPSLRLSWLTLGPQEPLLLLENHPSGQYLAEEMLDGQRQRVGIPAHATTAHNGHPLKRLEEDLY